MCPFQSCVSGAHQILTVKKWDSIARWLKMDEWTDGRTDRQMNGWKDGHTDRWMDG